MLKVIQDAQAWKAAQAIPLKASLPQCVGTSPSSNIPVANPYTWSCFSDAAWDSSSGNCGMGWHLRNPTNSFIESSSSHRRFVSSALVAEALAVKAALVGAVSSHVSSIYMYSDSKILISLLKSHGQDVVLKGVLHDITMLAQSFTSISFIYIRRLANVQADSIAKADLHSISSSAPIVACFLSSK